MDITYLLWLQGIRESLPPVVEQVFTIISAIAISKVLVIIPCLLYWCFDKRAGQFVLFTFTLGALLNQFVKNTACCYRPWIRDAAVHPAQGALGEATGYSFPSGHTQSAVDLFGSVGWWYRKRSKALLAFGAAFALAVGFSRNFLGVHAPQDVLVALLEGVLVIALVQRVMPWVEQAEGRDMRVLVVALVATAGYILYVMFKPYPLDYDATGALLVDPVAMQVDCFKAAGAVIGAVVGWYLERRFLSFEAGLKELGWKRIAVRMVVGLAIAGLVYVASKPLGAVVADERWLELLSNGILVFALVFVAPAAFCAIEKRLFASKG